MFGVPDQRTWFRLRQRERLTPLQIGARYGRGETEIRKALTSVLKKTARTGVRGRDTSKRQAAAFLATERERMGTWLRRPPMGMAQARKKGAQAASSRGALLCRM